MDKRDRREGDSEASRANAMTHLLTKDGRTEGQKDRRTEGQRVSGAAGRGVRRHLCVLGGEP